MKIFFSEKIKLLPLLLIFCLFLPACSRGSAKLELLFSDLEADIRFRRGDEIFLATIEVDSLSDGHRDARLCFSSPECLAGLSVSLSDGYAEITLDGIPLGETPEEYLRIISLLSPVGSFDYICKSGNELCYTNRDARWYFDSKSKLPIAIECDGKAKIEILRIERREK